jgi:hypothetical protein
MALRVQKFKTFFYVRNMFTKPLKTNSFLPIAGGRTSGRSVVGDLTIDHLLIIV